MSILESEIRALEKEFFKNKENNIYSNGIIRKKLLKVAPLLNFNLDLGNIECSEESEENKLYE